MAGHEKQKGLILFRQKKRRELKALFSNLLLLIDAVLRDELRGQIVVKIDQKKD